MLPGLEVVRYDGIFARECLVYKAPVVQPLLEGLTMLRKLSLQTIESLNLSYTELAGFPALGEVRLGVAGPDMQLRFTSSSVTRYDLANPTMTTFNLNAVNADLPNLQILDIKGDSLDSLLLNTAVPLQDLSISSRRCDVLFLDWDLVPDLRELQLACLEPMERLTSGMIPSFGRLKKLNMFVSFTYIDMDAILDAYNIGSNTEFRLASLTASECIDTTSQQRDSAFSCTCVDPPFVGASHCPQLRPFGCPNSNMTIAASPASLPWERCD